jgi:hypothetical protein
MTIAGLELVSMTRRAAMIMTSVPLIVVNLPLDVSIKPLTAMIIMNVQMMIVFPLTVV